MHAMKNGVWAAIEKLQGDVPGHIFEHAIVSHPKRILGAVAVWVPTVNSSRRAYIRSNKRGDRKDTVAVFTAARREGR
jgi:hypothetical protein